MLAYTEHQHFSKKITRKKPLAPNDKRCTHLHIAISYNPMPRRTPHLGRVTSILCTRFSTQRSTLFHAPQPRSYHLPKTTLSSVAEYAVLAYHTHIRLRLPVCLSITWHPTLGHRAIFYLIRPLNRGTHMGTSHGIFLIRELRFRLTASHTPTI